MIFVTVEAGAANTPVGADLVTVSIDGGERVAARMIGPVAGGPPTDERWRIDARYRIDGEGVPLASIAPESAPTGPGELGHDWGALGLPDGLDTRVRRAEEPTSLDELTRVRASSGYQEGDETPLLRLAPGERVIVGGDVGTVLAVDRRKRSVEVDFNGAVTVVAFDDIRIQETT